MANHAIVIGVQAYTDPAVPSLTTPSRDALHMANWLLDPAGGNVPADNLHLYLSPIPAVNADAPRVDLARLKLLGNLAAASRGNLLRAVQPLDHGERLFFYYSGHGMQSRITFSNEDAIVPADYESGVCNALSVNSLLAHFQGKHFPEQYFFFDCCRNVFHLGKEEPLDSFAPNPPSPGQRAPEQFVFYATAPGLEALDGRGMLTDVLLDGLGGKGKAKLWDLSQRQYTIQVNRLFTYVTDRFDNMTPAPVVGADGTTVLLQRPWLGGQHSHDPALVALPENQVQAVDFEVALSPVPALAAAQARLTVLGDGVEIAPFALNKVPFKLVLKPRTYSLALEVAPSFAVVGPWSLDVYDDPTTWSVALQPAAPSSSTPPPTPSAPPPPLAAVPVAVGSRGLESPERGGRLIVTATDQRSLLELLDTSGAAVLDAQGQPRTGWGKLDCSGLAPGVYRARLQTPEGRVVESVVPLEAGETLPVTLKAPQTALGALHEALGLARARLRRPTRLRPDKSFLARGPVEVRGRPGSVINVLLAAEPMPGTPLESADKVRDYLKGVAIRLWPFDQHPGDVLHPELTEDQSAAVLTAPAAPGPYWLWLATSDGTAAAFALTVLDERTTQLVFRQTAAGRIHVYQFLPDGGADEAAQRQLDLAQRFFERGKLGEALAALKELLAAPTLDPVAGCIAGYLLGREPGQADQLGRLADALVERFPGLPDAHVLRGRQREAAGQEARACYRDALDCGLPIFARYLEILAAAVARTDLAHPRRGLLEQVNQHRIPGLSWTAWTPLPGWPDAPGSTQPPEKQ